MNTQEEAQNTCACGHCQCGAEQQTVAEQPKADAKACACGGNCTCTSEK